MGSHLNECSHGQSVFALNEAAGKQANERIHGVKPRNKNPPWFSHKQNKEGSIAHNNHVLFIMSDLVPLVAATVRDQVVKDLRKESEDLRYQVDKMRYCRRIGNSNRTIKIRNKFERHFTSTLGSTSLSHTRKQSIAQTKFQIDIQCLYCENINFCLILVVCQEHFLLAIRFATGQGAG